ncbi:MAG: hypothetical protein JHC87_08585, partial [Thermoleophilaceae bacterium]|nr:hypothetical protein [Thermoleophilaceae bacterium]
GRDEQKGRRVSEVKEELGMTMDKNVAVFRDEERLKAQLEIIKRLQEEAKTAYIDDQGTVFNQDVLGSLELDFMLDVAETIVLGAIERKESRGAQYRTDFPERNDEEWLKHIDITKKDGEATISYSPVTITTYQPEARTY